MSGVSEATGTVKDLGASRTFKVITVGGELAVDDWKSLMDLLAGTTTYGATYPRIVYQYKTGTTINIKVMVINFSWNHLNNDQVAVMLTCKERK